MKMYKAFDKNLKCKGFQYEIGKTYTEDKADLCNCGFHACENPLDVLNYYNLCTSRFAQVELNDVTEQRHAKYSKRVGKSISILAELFLQDFIAEIIENLCKMPEVEVEDDTHLIAYDFSPHIATHKYSAQLFARINRANLAASGDDTMLISSGYDAKLAAAGDNAQLISSGYSAHLVAAGDNSKLVVSGFRSDLLAAGYGSKLISSGEYNYLMTPGNAAQLVSSGNHNSLMAAGDAAKLVATGDLTKLMSSGDSAQLTAEGEHSIIMSSGPNSKAKAKKGAWITLSEWEFNDKNEYVPLHVVTKKVDGKKIKSDTWYQLVNGKFTEVKEQTGDI